MPDDQTNSQDPQLSNNPNPEEQAIEQTFAQPVEQRSDVPVGQPVDQQPAQPAEPFQPTPAVPPAQTTAPVDYTDQTTVAPGVFGSSPEQPVVAVAPAPSKKPRKGLLIGLIVAAVLVVLGGGGALAYNFYYQNPDKVVGDALMNALTAKSVSSDATLDIKGDDYSAKITLSGHTNEEAAGLAKVKIDYTSEDLSYTTDGEGVFAKNGDLFVKVNNVKELADTLAQSSEGMVDFSLFDGVIEKVDSTWVKISGDDLGTVSEDYKDTQKCIADYTSKLSSDKALQKSVTDEIVTLYSNNKFVIIAENLGSKEVKGVGSLGYKLNFDSAKAETFTAALEGTQIGKKLKECDSTIDFKDVAKNLTEEGDSNGTTTTELWVSRFGHEITEMSLIGTGGEADGTLVVQPTFNKNEAVETPKDSMSVKELMTEIEKAYTNYETQIYSMDI